MLLLISIFTCLVASTGITASLEEEIIREMSLARTKPQQYAAYLREFRKLFSGNYYVVPRDEGVRMVTKEGVAAVDEAITFLNRQKSLPGLAWSDGLAEAAKELATEQEESGKTGHSGRCGDLNTRIQRQGEWQVTIGENIAYGPDTARTVVMQLIIDDGVPTRGHRKNIFNGDFRIAGAACAMHPSFRTVCVIDYAGGLDAE